MKLHSFPLEIIWAITYSLLLDQLIFQTGIKLNVLFILKLNQNDNTEEII